MTTKERERDELLYRTDGTPFSKLKAYERLSAQSISELAAGSFKAALFYNKLGFYSSTAAG